MQLKALVLGAAMTAATTALFTASLPAKAASESKVASWGLHYGRNDWNPKPNEYWTKKGDSHSVSISVTGKPTGKVAFFGRWGMAMNRKAKGGNGELGHHFGNKCGGGYRIGNDGYVLGEDYPRATVSHTWGFDLGAAYHISDMFTVRATGGIYWQDDGKPRYCEVYGQQLDEENTEAYFPVSAGVAWKWHDPKSGNRMGLSYDRHSILGNLFGIEFIREF